MVFSNQEQLNRFARLRLAGHLLDSRSRAGELVNVAEIAAQFRLDENVVLKALTEFQTLGMVTLVGNGSAVFHSSNPREMEEAYEIRAALEEIGGRAAAKVLK